MNGKATKTLNEGKFSLEAPRLTMWTFIVKYSFSLSVIVAIFLLSPSAEAMPKKHAMPQTHAMPFGATCYNNYGANNSERSVSGAMVAVRRYFAHRGYHVKLLEHNANFIKVELSKEKKVIDIIIVDIKSGRMRSAR